MVRRGRLPQLPRPPATAAASGRRGAARLRINSRRAPREDLAGLQNSVRSVLSRRFNLCQKTHPGPNTAAGPEYCRSGGIHANELEEPNPKHSRRPPTRGRSQKSPRSQPPTAQQLTPRRPRDLVHLGFHGNQEVGEGRQVDAAIGGPQTNHGQHARHP